MELARGSWPVMLIADVALLRGFVTNIAACEAAIDVVEAAAAFRHLRTPGGRAMSAAMTCCGALGWHSDARGYRYEPCDPLSGASWPPMPTIFRELAASAAHAAGYPGFAPDTCLVNRYRPEASMGSHRDADERDFSQPIVSVSLGVPAVFRWYGEKRSGTAVRVRLEPGDVLVWGGRARRGYHAVGKPEGGVRLNLTFRKAG